MIVRTGKNMSGTGPHDARALTYSWINIPEKILTVDLQRKNCGTKY